MTLNSYSLEEVDEAARDLLHALSDLDLPIPLAVLACCRVVSVIGTEEDIDQACRAIDTLRETPLDRTAAMEMEDEDDSGQREDS